MQRVIVFLALICSTFVASSQIEVGLKAGMSSTDLVSDGIIVTTDNGETIKLNFEDANYGVHFGLYTRLNLLGIYIEPAFIFNSSSVDYSIGDIDDGGTFDDLRNETYRHMDIPILVGIKAGILRLQAGPVAHIFLDSTSDLFDIDGYSQEFKEATYGFQAGVGLDIWKFRFDVNYEGNLTKFGDHITIDGHPYAFDNAASRLIFNVGLKF